MFCAWSWGRWCAGYAEFAGLGRSGWLGTSDGGLGTPRASWGGMTDTQIKKLADEAAQAGDLEQVAVCELALAGSASARAECERVVRAARAAAEVES